MSDPWELILHHTYAGSPGVIFDLSRGRGSHGRTLDLSDDAFSPWSSMPVARTMRGFATWESEMVRSRRSELRT